MGRKPKSWREIDDPSDIFGGDRQPEIDNPISDPAYDAFRRHIEEHIQGETKAFHELRSTAEQELQVKTPRRPEPRAVPSLPAAVRAAPEVRSKGLGVGTVVALSAIFAAIGFLSHSAWQQTQPLSRKTARLKNEANCVSATPGRKVVEAAPKKLPEAPAAPTAAAALPIAKTPEVAAPPLAESTPAIDVIAAPEPGLRGLTVRAVELRRGPGAAFEIVDSLPPGYAVEGSLTTDRLWLRVKPGAFVLAEAVQFQETAGAPGFQSYWVGPHIANIREFPLTTARILRKADPGSELKLQNFNGEWATVMGGGFVFRKLVTNEAPPVLQLPAVMRVSVEKAEIRGGPGSQYPMVGLYFRNHKVEVQEIQSGWLRVGQDQYIRAQEMELSAKPNTDKTM